MKTIFKLASRNIFRHARYSLGSALAVASGFLALSLFRAYMIDVAYMYEDSYQYRGMYGHLIIETNATDAQRRTDPWENVLTAEVQAKVDGFLKRRAADVEQPLKFLFGTGTITNGNNQAIFLMKGYQVAEGARIRGPIWEWDAAFGRPLSRVDSEESVVMGIGLSQILGCDLPDQGRKITKYGGYVALERPFNCPFSEVQLSASTASGQSNAVSARPVGIINGVYKEIDERFLNAPLSLVQRLYRTDAISAYSVLLKPQRDVAAFVSDFNAFSQSEGIPIHAVRWQDHRQGELYLRTMNLLQIFRNFVVTILVAITGLSVFNTFLKAVKERTREIGTLRSIGYTERTLLAVFGIEAALLCGIGTLLGTALAILITGTVNTVGILYKAGMLADPVPFRIAYSYPTYATSAAFLIVVSILAAILAARGTTRATVAENISHV